MNIGPLIAVFFAAFFISLGGIVLLRRCWRFEAGMDTGDGLRKEQKNPVLRIGGLPIFAAFVAVFLYAVLSGRIGEASGFLGSWTFLILALTIFVVGFVDDLFGMPATIKLAAQIAVGTAAFMSGLSIHTISNPFGPGALNPGSFSLILTVLWIVAIPNLINLIDGLDGLAGGIGLFLALTLGTLGMLTGNVLLATLSFGVAGALIGFLVFNLPPAKIYLGDGGAYLIGFLIAVSSLASSNKGSVISALLVVIIALGFPILDTGLTIIRRMLSGLPVMQADARHLHHRLMTLGLSKRAILLILYGVFAGLSLLGISVFVSQGYTIPVVGMVLVVAFLSMLRHLGLPHTPKEVQLVLRDIVAVRKDVRYACCLAHVLDHDIERIRNADDYWQALVDSMAKVGIHPEPEAVEPAQLQAVHPGETCLVVFPLTERRAWHLRCPAPTGRRRQWDRVIRCFVAAVFRGEERWGICPDGVGVREVPPTEDIKALEESINLSRRRSLSENRADADAKPDTNSGIKSSAIVQP